MVILYSVIIESRTLLIGSFVLLLLLSIKSLKQFLIIFFAAVTLLLFLSDLAHELLISKQDHSNGIRLIMILSSIGDSVFELLFGIGLESWRKNLYVVLPDTQNIHNFIPTANIHFLPAEFFLNGGIFFLIVFILLVRNFMSKNFFYPPLIGILVSTFFTTNTGYERLLLSVCFSLVLLTKSYDSKQGLS